jgi:hypothetical protein
MHLRLRCLGISVLAGLNLAARPFTDHLLQDESFWGDGRAEIAVFMARENRYGTLRETEVRHILVRENFAATEAVKADDWQAPGTYAVIKLNQVITVPTGSYRYDQGHSAFWRLADGELIKFSSTTNDSCGLSYKQGNRQGDTWHYRAFTYWEGMSEVNDTVSPPAGALTYDELPFKLRLLDFGKVTLFEAPLLDSVIDSRSDELTWKPAAFALARIPSAWRVTVKHAHGTDRFFFDVESPHALQRWERWNGSELERTQLIRLPYWQLNQPGDERYLESGAGYP